METVAGAAEAGAQPLSRRLARVAIWIGGIALLFCLLELLGLPVFAWVRDLLDKVGEIPPWAIVAGISLETAQTSLAAAPSRSSSVSSLNTKA